MNGKIGPRIGDAALPPINGRRRIASLDGVRGLAVIFVLAVHFQSMSVLPQRSAMLRWLADIMSWGWCGVDLFFVLSGFLITSILVETKNAEKRSRIFYSRRILRIFPLYYAVVLSCLAASTFVRHSSLQKALGPSALGWIAYLLYFQNWWLPFGKLQHMVFLGPFWSLALEEQFYLVWPLCVWRLSAKALMNVCALGTIMALMLRWWLMLHPTVDLTLVAYMNTLTRMDGVLVGAFCAIAVRDTAMLRRVGKLIPIALVAAVSGLALLVFRGHEAWNDRDVLVYGHLLLAIGFGCLVLSAYLANGTGTLFDRAICSKGLTAFGRYSYGIYIFQGFILELLLHMYRNRPWWGHSIRNALFVALGWLVVPFCLAFLSYHLFKKRFQRLGHSFAADIPPGRGPSVI